jgi:hypothetical protein
VKECPLRLVNELKVKLFKNKEDYIFRLIIEKLIRVSLSISKFEIVT